MSFWSAVSLSLWPYPVLLCCICQLRWLSLIFHLEISLWAFTLSFHLNRFFDCSITFWLAVWLSGLPYVFMVCYISCSMAVSLSTLLYLSASIAYLDLSPYDLTLGFYFKLSLEQFFDGSITFWLAVSLSGMLYVFLVCCISFSMAASLFAFLYLSALMAWLDPTPKDLTLSFYFELSLGPFFWFLYHFLDGCLSFWLAVYFLRLLYLFLHSFISFSVCCIFQLRWLSLIFYLEISV